VVPLFADGTLAIGASSARECWWSAEPTTASGKATGTARPRLSVERGGFRLSRRAIYRRQDMDRWLTEQQQAVPAVIAAPPQGLLTGRPTRGLGNRSRRAPDLRSGRSLRL